MVELAAELEKLGNQTRRIYLYSGPPDHPMIPMGSNDRLLGYPMAHLFEKIPTLHPGLLTAIVHEISSFSPDIVLLNGSRTLKYGAMAKRLLSSSIKWVSRVIDNPEFWNRGVIPFAYYKHWVIPSLDGAVGVSKASMQAMIRHYGFEKPVKVIHRTFDFEKFKKAMGKAAARRELGLSVQDEVLLFLGNLSRQKRPDRFLEIFKSLKKTRPHLKALIVGGGDDLSKYTPIIDSDSDIIYTGYQRDVSPYLAASDLLLLTSDTEGLPGVILEAAYFGIPTISTEVGGIKECLEDGESGYLIPDKSIEGFGNKINELLDNAGKRTEMGLMAKKLVEEKFRLDKATKDYLEFFQGIIRNQHHVQ